MTPDVWTGERCISLARFDCEMFGGLLRFLWLHGKNNIKSNHFERLCNRDFNPFITFDVECMKNGKIWDVFELRVGVYANIRYHLHLFSFVISFLCLCSFLLFLFGFLLLISFELQSFSLISLTFISISLVLDDLTRMDGVGFMVNKIKKLGQKMVIFIWCACNSSL